MRVRDRLDGLWRDEDFADWYPRDGRPGLSPAQLATVCVLQFVLNLPDRQAAEAVRCRIDFKYAMVRHEAPLFPGGGERPPPLVCRSRLAKLRAA
ncbi:transposase [Streptomyces sp. Lzd4kr]|nr:transposase [Streptomyces sp. Lzd4kr]